MKTTMNDVATQFVEAIAGQVEDMVNEFCSSADNIADAIETALDDKNYEHDIEVCKDDVQALEAKIDECENQISELNASMCELSEKFDALRAKVNKPKPSVIDRIKESWSTMPWNW